VGPDRADRVAGRLLELAEVEHRLVLDGRADELDELHAQRASAMAELPAELSEPARATLRHALALQRQVSVALGQALGRAGRELGQVRHGRTAAAGYAPAGVDPRRVLDRSA
jgi:hypothetical protein